MKHPSPIPALLTSAIVITIVAMSVELSLETIVTFALFAICISVPHLFDDPPKLGLYAMRYDYEQDKFNAPLPDENLTFQDILRKRNAQDPKSETQDPI